MSSRSRWVAIVEDPPGWLIAALLVVLAILFSWPLWPDAGNVGIHDWDMNFFKQGVAVRSITDYGQVPLWNPWYFGGYPAFGDPESRYLYPTFLLQLVAGEIYGIKLEIVVHYALALGGMYVLVRHHRVARSAAFTAAILYGFGALTMPLSNGMAMFALAALIPWLFYFYERAFERMELALVAGGVIALLFLGGFVAIIPILGLALVYHGAAITVARRARWTTYVTSLAITCLAAPAFAAVKLLPALAIMRKYPRVVELEIGGYSVATLVEGLVSRNQSVLAPPSFEMDATSFLTGNTWGVAETGIYIGIAGTLVALAGLALAVARREWRRVGVAYGISLVIALWFAFGYRAPISIWRWVRELPVFDGLRVPERNRYVVMLLLALFAAFAVHALLRWLASRTAKRWDIALSIALPALVFADLLVVSAPELATGSVVPVPVAEPAPSFEQGPHLPPYGVNGWDRDYEKLEEMEQFVRWNQLSWYKLYPALLANRGGLETDAPLGIDHKPAAVSVDDPAYRGEVYIEGTRGTARYREWTPNRLKISATLDATGLVVVNQNHDDGWTAERGTVVNHHGLLAVQLPPGQHDVALEYRPRSLLIGLVVSLVSLAIAVLAFRWMRRRRAAAT